MRDSIEQRQLLDASVHKGPQETTGNAMPLETMISTAAIPIRQRCRRRTNMRTSMLIVAIVVFSGSFCCTWLSLQAAVVVNAQEEKGAAAAQAQQQEQQLQQQNMLQQFWRNLQQATSQKHQRRIIHHQQQESAATTPESQQSQQSSSTAAAAAKRPQNPLAVPTQQKRRALYQYALSSHYGNYESKKQQSKRQTNESMLAKDEYQTAWEAYAHPTFSSSTDRSSANSEHASQPPLLDRTTSLHAAWPPFPRSKQVSNREWIKRMFAHGYDSYMQHAYPAGEVHPVSCQPGTFNLVKIPALSVLDSLDTLLVLHNTTEFARACERLKVLEDVMAQAAASSQSGRPPMARRHTIFSINQNVSVFETNIRVLGGLLSAHQLALAMQLDQAPSPSPLMVDQLGGEEPKRRPLLVPPVRMVDVFTSAGTVRWGPVLESGKYKDVVAQTIPTSKEQQPIIDMEVADISLDDMSDMVHVQERHATCASSRLLSEHDCTVQLHGLSMASSAAAAAKLNQTKVEDADESTTTSTASNSDSSSQSSPTEYWTYDGFLLDWALDIGTRLLPAFNTATGIPYGTVNLLYGVPSGETPIASLAGGGTLSLEFELLSRLTGDARFGKAAKLASRALFRQRSVPLNLFGKHIDTRAGVWTESLSGIGSNSDSFIEYLAKQYILFPEDDDFWIMLQTAYAAIFSESRYGEWYADVEMTQGTSASSNGGRRVFESLAAFYPGMQVLLGEIAPAARSLNSFFMVREALGFLPERFNYGVWNFDLSREGSGIHPLRPELLESCYFMHRATKGMGTSGSGRSSSSSGNAEDETESEEPSFSGWQWAADFALHKLERTAKTTCGYASLRELKPQTTGAVNSSASDGIKHMDEMPSYFLSETLKYLYLTFDEDNFLHRDDNHEWIFTTEAHPIHNVPTKRTPKSTIGPASVAHNHEFANDVTALKKLLKGRLKERRLRSTAPVPSAKSKNGDLIREKWTTVTDYRSYRDDIDAIVTSEVTATAATAAAATMENVNNRTAAPTTGNTMDWIMAIVPPSPYVLDEFRESFDKGNTAHLSLGNWGSGRSIRKACRNIYSSDMLWMHAINGGSTDYSDTYISTGHDSLIDHAHSYTLLGAADALGALGSGVYQGEKDNEDLLCPTSSLKEETPQSQSDGTDPGSQEGATLIPTDIGNFLVETFADGTGFQIHNDASGEIVKVNVLHDVDEMDKIVMVLSELKSSSAKPTEDATPTLQRRVSIMDFEGNAFSCEINVSREYSVEPAEGNELAEPRQDLVLNIPCSSSLFGPSQFSMLKTQEEVFFESILVGPSKDNQFGCNEPGLTTGTPIPDGVILLEKTDVENEHSMGGEEVTLGVDSDIDIQEATVRVVHRGECTFFAKAFNSKSKTGAGALIVMNNVDDEVFMMSSYDDEANDVDPLDLPLTVLISGLDGEALFQILNEETEEPSTVVARVSIKRRLETVGADGMIVNSDGDSRPERIHWPIVRGNADLLEILVENGWGVRGLQVQTEESREWQLQLLRHMHAVDESSN